MSATVRRRRVAAQPSYEVLQWRQTWRIRNGQPYREAVVRRADGELRIFLIADDVAAAA
jgi:hypothetical protein